MTTALLSRRLILCSLSWRRFKKKSYQVHLTCNIGRQILCRTNVCVSCQVIAQGLEKLRDSLKKAVARAEVEVDPTLVSGAMDACELAGLAPDDPALDEAWEAMKEVEIKFAIKQKQQAVLQVGGRVRMCVHVHWVTYFVVHFGLA